MREATKTPITTLRELKASAAVMGETLQYKNCYLSTSPVKDLWESGKEKATVEQTFSQRHVRDSKVNWRKVLVTKTDETKLKLFGH